MASMCSWSTLAPGHQRGVGELVVGDRRQQRLRQVVVDVGVHPEQHVAQRRQPRLVGGPECHRPRPGRASPTVPLLEGVEVEPGEHDVPALHPRSVDEAARRASPRGPRSWCGGTWPGSAGAGRRASSMGARRALHALDHVPIDAAPPVTPPDSRAGLGGRAEPTPWSPEGQDRAAGYQARAAPRRARDGRRRAGMSRRSPCDRSDRGPAPEIKGTGRGRSPRSG